MLDTCMCCISSLASVQNVQFPKVIDLGANL